MRASLVKAPAAQAQRPPLLREPPPIEDPKFTAFREHVRIDRNALDSAVEQQAHLFMSVCEEHVRYASIRDEAKDRLARHDARCAREFRRKAEAAKERVTEAMVNDAVMLDEEHIRLSTELNSISAQTERWWALRIAYDQRVKMLRELVGLYASGYFSAEAAASPRAAVRDALAATARARLEERRREGK